ELACSWLSEVLGVPFWQTIRLLIVGTDMAVAGSLWWVVSQLRGPAAGRLAACLYALSPIAVLISGYHGMFDPLPILLCMLSVGLFLNQRSHPGAAGLLLGLAISLKPLAAPVALVLLLRAEFSRAERLRLLVFLIVTLAVVCLPFLASAPEEM